MCALRMARNLIVPVIIVFLIWSCSAQSEADLLLKFRDALTQKGELAAWNISLPPCNWDGLRCFSGSVYGLEFGDMGLKGTIDVDALSNLPHLISLNLSYNNFEGNLPNLSKLELLRALYLSGNHFEGVFRSDDFCKMNDLRKLHLSKNNFSGKIPWAWGTLTELFELRLQNNLFSGELPEFQQKRLLDIDVSNNNLTGKIPYRFGDLEPSAFQGNKLCDPPLSPCHSPTPVSIILICFLVIKALASVVGVFLIHLRRRPQAPPDLDEMEQGQVVADRKKSEPNVKITFLREVRQVFEMTDLLKASAEILGSGMFGSTYKAAVSPEQVVVVKRFRQMNNVRKEEFDEHMRRLGRLNHPNVLNLLGFYYRKEEKLFVSSYVDRGSLASHLHGSNRSRPDWPTRLKILKGVARGLLYLYDELPSVTAPHGHLKSSNVLLDASYTPLLADYGIIPVVSHEHAQQHMIAYKSPEYKRSSRITKKTDVWSLGILIVETLTGRLPSSFLHQGKGGSDVEASFWVESVANDEENDVDVFDADIVRDENEEGEMRKLLRIGFDCCQVDVDMRPHIREAVDMIEEVKESAVM